MIARVVARAKKTPAGQWIIGRGWDQNDWGDTRFPTHEKLTAAVPNNPVYLTRVDGHAGLANAAALKAAGVTAQTKDPDGGHIERAADGSPAGVFVDNAQGLVERVVPQPTRAEVKSDVQAAIAEAQKWGLTGVHDAGASAQTLEIYEELGKAHALNFRLYAMISDDSATIAKWFARGPLVAGYDSTLWIRSVKLYADGALGSRGAALLDPYSDNPTTTGPPRLEARASRGRGRARAQGRVPGEHARDRRSRQPRSCSTHTSRHSRRCPWPTIASASSTRRSSTPTTFRASRRSASSRRCRRAIRRATCTGRATGSGRRGCWGAAAVFGLRKPFALSTFQQQAIAVAIVTVAAGVAFLGLLSVQFDFGSCVNPSRSHPYFTSGRLLSGAMIPFALSYVFGISCFCRLATSRFRETRWIDTASPLIVLGAIVVFSQASEIFITRPVFASEHNWFHG